MDRHFSCTACGKCCEGWLPLSIDDALAHADRFPLFLLWTPLRPGGKSYDLSTKLGFTLKLKKRKQVAVRLSPVSYVPTGMPCPALGSDGLCDVHEAKPLRCRAMPLSGGHAEIDQTELLIPKPGWECDISDAATLVYQNKKIITRQYFQLEREQMIADGEILNPFAQLLLDAKPDLRMELEKIATHPQGGRMITNFSVLLQRLSNVDIVEFAAKQLPVMSNFAKRCAGMAQYKDEYGRFVACAKDWQRVLDGAT